jgi:F-type H+-transporting ATPase subunit delta
MKTTKQAQRDARQLFRLCLVNGSLDEERARSVVDRLVGAARPGTLPVLTRFHRLVRLDGAKHRAEVTSAVLLTPDLRAQLEAAVARLYGPGIAVAFAEDPALLGGVRITVGSDVYDGSIRGGLAALESKF